MKYIILFIFPLVVIAQEQPKMDVKPVSLEKFHHYQKHKKFYKEDINYLIEAKFFPLGWSKKENFAFIIEYADEAIGELRAELFIYDVKSSIVIENILFKEKLNFKEISKLMKKYAINNYNSNTLSTFPLRYSNIKIDVDKYATYQTKPHYFENDEKFIREVNIRLTKSEDYKKIDEKSIYKHLFDEDDFTYDTLILGYILSPSGKSMIVVLNRFERGWEGPPHITKFIVTGVDLENIFKN
jgi:hypothetical protein